MADQHLSIAHHYHQRTKYDPKTLAQKARPIDWEHQPDVFKEYKVGASYALKPFLSNQPPAEMDGRNQAIASHPDHAYAWKRLARLLLCSYGLTAKMLALARKPIYFRAVPSAGGLYPAEVYLISRGTTYLPPGLYHYQAQTHSLIHFWDSPVWNELRHACFWHPALDNTQLALVTTAIFFRSAWRYHARAYRRICLDTGHLLGNIELACAINHYRPHLISGFADQALNELLYLDGDQEGAIALIPLADLLEVDQNLPPFPTALPSALHQTDDRIDDDSLLFYFHQATSISSTQDVNWSKTLRYEWGVNSGIEPENDAPYPEDPEPSPSATAANTPPSASPAKTLTGDSYNFPFCYRVNTASPAIEWGADLLDLEQTILKRRSTREYNGENLTLEELKALLDFAYQPQHYLQQGLDGRPDYCDLSLLETFIAVSGVKGLDAGCYYYAPIAQELRQIRFKNFRQELHQLCLGQNLGRDAGAVIFHTADLSRAVERYGDRAYRYLHIDAGHLGQRLNLAAIRLGLGVSGIGGFFDDTVNEVLGIPVDEAVIYITTLGRPR